MGLCGSCLSRLLVAPCKADWLCRLKQRFIGDCPHSGGFSLTPLSQCFFGGGNSSPLGISVLCVVGINSCNNHFVVGSAFRGSHFVIVSTTPCQNSKDTCSLKKVGNSCSSTALESHELISFGVLSSVVEIQMQSKIPAHWFTPLFYAYLSSSGHA